MRIRATLATAATVLATVPAVASAAAGPGCSQLAVTPAGTPLVVWCVTVELSALTAQVSEVRLWRSSGDGRWTAAKAANLVVDNVPAPPQVSPGWARDRTLYWATEDGLYASTDLGDSFRLVSPLVTGTDHPIRGVLLTDTGSAVRASVAGYDPHDVGYTTVGDVSAPVVGSPDEDLTFVQTAAGTGVLAWDAVTTDAHRVVGYSCTELLACSVPWFTLPVPADRWAHQLAGTWRRPAAAATEPTYLAVREGERFARVALWQVTSAPRRMPAAEAAVAAVTDGRSAPLVGLAFAGQRLVLRVVSWADRHGTTHDRVLASDDRGATWRVVTAAATDARGRSRGPAGWRPGAVATGYVPAIVARDDLLLVNASDGARYTLRCSRDRGRHWRSACN